MENGGDILQLCRLCLVKDDVNISIFEEQGDIRQILQKISSCLPVKVSREDKLPKKICDGCSYKLDMFYEFWNSTANAEKQLLSWLGEIEMKSKLTDGAVASAVAAQQMKPAETVVKQEAIDPSDIHTEENDDDKSYTLFPQGFSAEEAGSSATAVSNEEPPPKRARRTAAVKAQIAMDPESDDDDDSGEPVTKVEDESEESEGDDRDPPFVDAPSTSADDQPGPSGVGKDGAEAPLAEEETKPLLLDEIKEENLAPNSESTTLKCACGELFEYPSKPKSHPISHTEVKTFSCSICIRKFKRKSDLTQHMRVHGTPMAHVPNASKSFECDFCSVKLMSRKSWMIHRKRHLKEYVAKCKVCSQGFVTKVEYNNHMGSKHGNKSNLCNICGKHFRNKYMLQSHSTIHSENNGGTRSIVCDLCNKTFIEERQLNSHLAKVHVNKDRKYICDRCGKMLTTITGLQHHLLLHKGLKPVQCKVCGKSFALSKTLKVHMQTHNEDQRPYECTKCGKCFRQRSSLAKHMKCHTGERPYVCNVCNDGFASKTTLTFHQKKKHNMA